MLNLSRTEKYAVLGVAVPTSVLLLYWLLKSFRDDGDDERSGGSKAATSRQTIIEVKVPRKDVGIVIGRQGSTIKQLQEETGAKLNFKDGPQGDTEDRTVVIRGTPETAQAAECAIRKLLADRPIITQEEMLVPGYTVGRIIGKGGENVRQMSRTSKAKIYVDRTRDGYRDQSRLITISGTAEQIELAKALLQEKIQEEEEARAKEAVAAANRDVRKKSKGTKYGQQSHVTNKEVAPMHESWDTKEQREDSGTITTSLQSTLFPRIPDYAEVYVSAVAHPGIFWVQRVSATGLKLDELVQQMTRYYDSTGQEDCVTCVKPGEVVAAPLEGDSSWYRAQVMGVDDNQLDLFYVDYGDSTFMDIGKVRHLGQQFFMLPQQAIECRLAGVTPNGEWPEESIEKFEEITHCAKWKVIMAKAEKFTGEIPHLTLIDTNGETDININAEMVRLGYAVTDSDT